MFKLSKRSKSRMNGIHSDLKRVALRAIQLSEIDFGISEGVRDLETQKEYVAKGVSRTMKSSHLKQWDGKGHALDVYAYVGGQVRWEMELYVKIAKAFQLAAVEEGVPLVWGGCWVTINSIGSLQRAQDRYIDRKRKAGKRPFLDGPHFELQRKAYAKAA